MYSKDYNNGSLWIYKKLKNKYRILKFSGDVDAVVQKLVAELGEERFDSLITVAGESVAEATRDQYLSVLWSIARLRTWQLPRNCLESQILTTCSRTWLIVKLLTKTLRDGTRSA